MDVLDPIWRTRADPLADDAVAALGPAARPGQDLWQQVQDRSGQDPRLQAFVDHVHAVNLTLRPEQFEAGRRMALSHAPHTFLSLLAGALIESFAHAGGAEVLSETGRLERDAKRRVYETASLIRDALLPSGFALTGRGASALLRVRLLHASVRAWMATRDFDPERHGVPINQADMLHTLLLFDRVLVRGIRELGGAVDAEEDAAWCALWCHAGRLIGIEEALIPDGPEDAARVYDAICEEVSPSAKSVQLTDAVLGAFALEPPFFLPKSALVAISHQLVDGRLADRLGLSPGRRAFRAALTLVRRMWGGVEAVNDHVPGARGASVRVGHLFVEVNRARVLRWMDEADYSFRTA